MRTLNRRPIVLLASILGAAGLVALPAAAAPQGGVKPPPALQAQMRHLAAGKAATRSQDNDAADAVMASAQLDALITSAPAVQAPSAALAAAQRQAAALPAQGGSWTEISRRPFLDDPVPGRNGVASNYGVNWGLVSGRMTAATSRGSVVYAGGADGGVWVTTDRGKNWRNISRGLPRISVGALATDPADGSIWLGLGEANTNFDAADGMGVFRLTRGSSTWQRVGGKEINTANTYALRFIGSYAYAATSRGLWRHSLTSRSGAWQLVMKPDPNRAHSIYRTSHVTSVVAVPGTGGRKILAALGWRGGTLPTDTKYNGFYVSKHGGAPGTFHRIALTGDINPAEIGRTTFDTATNGGRQIYAVVEDTASVSLLGEGVFVSRNGNPAGPWIRIADVAKLMHSGSAMQSPQAGFFPGVQAWYNQYVKVDPNNPNHAYLGLEEIFETTDGGAHWFAIGPYWDFGISCATDYYTCPPTTHPDQHSITFAGRQVYVGSDGGMWRRSITDHHRAGWVDLNKTLDTLQYYSVAVGRAGGGDAVWGGMQDNGESFLRQNLPRQLQVFTGDGGDTIVNPKDGRDAVDEYVYADQFLTTDAGRHYREIAVSCLATTTRPPIANCDPNPRFITPLEQDVNKPTHWITGGQYIWTDSAGWNTVCDLSHCDWKQVHDLGAGNSTTALAMNGRTIYAGFCGGPCGPDQGGPFIRGVVTNAGGSWHDVSTGLPNRYVTALRVDPADPSHVYAVLGGYNRRWIPSGGVGHVFESTNAGRTWHNVSGNLPDAPALQLVISHGHLVIATDVGVYVSGNGGSTWRRLGSGLPRVRVWDLTLSTNGRTLYAATHGRGMWSIAAP